MGGDTGSRGRGSGRKKNLEPVEITELLGIALGGMGLTLEEFCAMDYEEFGAVQRAWASQRDAEYKDRWERTRAIAMAAVAPHMDKRHRLTAAQLMPFPWDRKPEPPEPKKAKATDADWRARAEALAKKLGAKTTKDGK